MCARSASANVGTAPPPDTPAKAAAAEALGACFPAHGDTLAATAQEVADSRRYAGIHYRLDNDVGMEIGRELARLAAMAVTQGALALAP